MNKVGFYSTFLVLLVVLTTLSSAAEQYQRVARDLHNKLRKKHRVSGLNLSEDLNKRAIKCAQYYANKGSIRGHDCPYKGKDGEFGENLASARTSGSFTNVQVAKMAINDWYAEEKFYKYTNIPQKGTGHFSQLVWKKSNQLGFGVAKKGKEYYTCALYSPAGNVGKQYKDNVLKP